MSLRSLPRWWTVAAGVLTVACFLATVYGAVSWYRAFMAIGDLHGVQLDADEMRSRLHLVYLLFFLTGVLATAFVALLVMRRPRAHEPATPLPWH